MTLADIRGWVRGKLGDSAFASALIDPAANWFVDSVLNEHSIRFMQENETLYASQGDTAVDFPDDFQTLIKEGFFLVTPQVYQLTQYKKEYGDFMKLFPGFATYVPAPLRHWTTFANTMRFSAPLNADISINCDYYKKSTHMTLATDTCDIPDNYQEMVVLGTLARCMQTNEDYPEATQELANLSPLITAFVASEGAGQEMTGPVIIRTNRRGGNLRSSEW